MTPIKFYLFLFIFLMGWNWNAFGQTTKKIYVGMYCSDLDNPSGSPAHEDGVNDNVTDPSAPIYNDHIGYDYNYLYELKKYNYNLIIGVDPSLQEVTSTTSPSKTFLDRIQSMGLKIFLQNHNFDVIKQRNSIKCDTFFPAYLANSSQVNLGLNHYNSHPAVEGYHIADEPCKYTEQGTNNWNHLGNIVDQIHTSDNQKISYINLWPNYGYDYQYESNNLPALAITPGPYTYDQYVNDYVNSSPNINMISFDYYPLFSKYDACNSTKTLFKNLDKFARIATTKDIPFYYVTNIYKEESSSCSGGLNYNAIVTSPGELNYNLFSGLIHGAKGIMYWLREGMYYCNSVYDAYSLNPNYDKNTDALWTASKNHQGFIHKKLISHAAELGGLKYEACFHATGLPEVSSSGSGIYQEYNPGTSWTHFLADPATTTIFNTTAPISPMPSFNLASPNASDYLAFSYLSDAAGEVYLWVMNKNHKGSSSQAFTMNFNGLKNVTEILEDRMCVNMTNITIELEPGEAKLFLIKNGMSGTLNVSTDFIGTYTTTTANTINLMYGVDVVADANVKFMANQITLYDGVKISGAEALFAADDTHCSSFNRTPSVVHSVVPSSSTVDFMVSPNPSNGLFSVQTKGSPNQRFELVVHSTLGQIVHKQNIEGESSAVLNLESLKNGIYVISLTENSITQKTTKIVVNH